MRHMYNEQDGDQSRCLRKGYLANYVKDLAKGQEEQNAGYQSCIFAEI